MTSCLFNRSIREQFVRRVPALALVALLLPSAAGALGILVPREASFSPIQLGHTEVRAEIRQNLAKTRVVQEFYNPNPRQLEADFFFPVPKGADVTDFVLYMNGQPVKGEVLEKEKARDIYEGIVRKMQDPGLLEWLDHNLFKVRVFPVPASGTQKIELEFAQPLQADQGTFRYTFPLRSPKGQAVPAERAAAAPDINFAVDIRSDEPVRNVQSPTHPVTVDTKDPKAVHVTVDARSFTAGAGDFVLFYEPSRKDVAMSLVATRPDPAGDGFFSLMLSPPIKAGEAPVAPQDVTFVIDTSGSMMEGNKIEQARRALAYCVGQLRPQDRFALIRFSTETEKFREGLVPATKENLEAAQKWVAELKARGGTNIGEAVGEALALRAGSDAATTGTAETTGTQAAPPTGSRIYTVVFVTDGLPTVGQTDPEQILQTAKSALSGKTDSQAAVPVAEAKSPGAVKATNVRIFTFGVGNDVNTKLLDRLADETRAAAEYIRPGEDLESPISRFFDKIAQPAMTGLHLEIPGAEAYDLYPKDLPDLFYGTQLTVFGRYKKPGPTAIRLSGSVAGKPAEFTYEKTLPERETENSYVEKLWGTRKIAYLLESIRNSGESAEVKDEVIRLAKKYGVVTPYTSYLVTEDTPVAAEPPRPIAQSRSPFRREAPATFSAPRQQNNAASVPPGSVAMRSPAGRMSGAGMAPAAPQAAAAPAPMGAADLAAESGAGAVAVSERLRAMKKASSPEAAGAGAGDMRSAGGRTFRLAGGVWTDTQIAPGEAPKLKIKYLSQAYFDALQLNPELREAFALGERVQVKLAGGVLEITPDGKEALEGSEREFLSGGKNP